MAESKFEEISICTKCYKIHLRREMHPAYPCPECGAKVLDGFSAKVERGFWNFITGKINIVTSTLKDMKADWYYNYRDERQIMINGAKKRYGI